MKRIMKQKRGKKKIPTLHKFIQIYNFVTGKFKRGPPGCSVAIESNFGLILSGPNGNNKKEKQLCFSNIANLYTMFVDNISHKIGNDLNLKGSIQTFWK